MIKIKAFKNLIVDYLEEILTMLGFLFFIIFSFLVNLKLGFAAISVSFLSLAFLTVKYKKNLNK